MAYNCVITHETDYVRVEVSGRWEPGGELGNAVDVWTRVADACRETGETRILSLWDVSGHLPMLDAYSLASAPDSFGWEHNFKLAVVHLHEERFSDALFAETVAVNRGYEVKIFRDERSAKEWLQQFNTAT